ncbi:MAG: hydrogenase maturation protease, partial [Thermoanaerobaculaceae bacterium]|nr:hydrogenase maturation protease [Thermoanaerobaculaceae bacterium]
MRRILIIGFGNSLQGDDGVGPAVVARLAACPLPPGVRVVEGGTDSLRLPQLWEGEEEVWVVDAVTSGATPGTLPRVGHEQLLQEPQHHASAHTLSLPESLRWLELACPELASVRYELWGIEVAT